MASLRFEGGALGSVVVSSQRPGLWGRLHAHGANGASAGVQTDGGLSFVAGVSAATGPPVNDLQPVPGYYCIEVYARPAQSEFTGGRDWQNTLLLSNPIFIGGTP